MDVTGLCHGTRLCHGTVERFERMLGMLMDRHMHSSTWTHSCVIACLFLLGIFAPGLWRDFPESHISRSVDGPRSIVITQRVDPLQAQDRSFSSKAVSQEPMLPSHEQRVAPTVAIERATGQSNERPSLYIQELGPPQSERTPPALDLGISSVKHVQHPESHQRAGVQPRVLNVERNSASVDGTGPTRRTPLDHTPDDHEEQSRSLTALRRVTDSIVLRPAIGNATRAGDHGVRLVTSKSRHPRDVEKDRLSPVSLLRQLRQLTAPPVAVDWADQVSSLVTKLTVTISDPNQPISPELDRLSAFAVRGESLAANTEVNAERRALLIASYAIVRRVDLWRGFRAILDQARTVDLQRRGDAVNVAQWVATAHDRLASVDHPDQWRAFLLLDDAHELTKPDTRWTAAYRRKLAEGILRRLSSPKLNQRQREFFASSPFPQLTRSLQRWVTEPVDYSQLLNDLERYESASRRDVAKRIAEQYNHLRWSPSFQLRHLGEQVNLHYRNANFRVAVSGDLLNRLLPTIESLETPIDECVEGVQVTGSSQARTDLALRLIPAPWAWRLRLEARGVVDSYTESSSWPAQLANHGQTTYQAHKLLLVDSLGAFPDQSHAAATGESTLTDLKTSFDRIPVMRFLVRTMVMREYEKVQPLAQKAMETRVSRTVEQRLDDQVQQSLVSSRQQMDNRLLEPLRRLGLQPRVVHLQTTERQLIGRYRVASDRQLAAHTPRPRAPR